MASSDGIAKPFVDRRTDKGFRGSVVAGEFRVISGDGDDAIPGHTQLVNSLVFFLARNETASEIIQADGSCNSCD